MEKVILVIGATGNQGGAVARHLLPTEFKVRGFTRNPQSVKTRALAERGAEIVKGDLDEPGSLLNAMEGAYGVFCAINMREGGVEVEEARGKRVADAVKLAGIDHFIYSSVGGADRYTGIPHFESKRHIEEYISSLHLPATILRPVAFMENFLFAPAPAFLSLMRTFLGEKKLQLVSVEDIGQWARLAFRMPEAWLGKAVEFAGDELNYREIEEAYRKVTGKREWALGFPATLAMKMLGDFGKMFTWFKVEGYRADIEKCRHTIPHSVTFEEFLMEKVKSSKVLAA